MSEPTPRSSYRFTAADKNLIAALAGHHGVSETDALRLAVRQAARTAGLSLQPSPEKRKNKSRKMS